ncbi:aldo/keto reductase [Spiroplasma sp. SV19]|uniref:aldo/keto reductase family protein n=1 Tax=Spiroplasma sp. SV19 TaxID=2570468 RepID=UPI0024B6B68A|nr:aldo/keto reductase [Spiroplasma sp. SV19]WHQ37304.1 aldo/keto reductase [Spiroplasma sp. SV19]
MPFRLEKIGFGTLFLKKEEAIINALENGYKIIDTAKVYQNEEMVGQAIKKYLITNNTKREDVIIETKIWCDDIEADNTTNAVLEALKRLDVNYLDIVLIHRPNMNFHKTIKAYGELLQCKAQGLIRVVGVSNFDKDMIEVLFEKTGIYPNINQIEFSPFNQRWDRVQYCQDKNILVQAYSSITKVLENQLLITEAKKYNCTVAQLVLAWVKYFSIQPIVKSETLQHIKENNNIEKIKLTKKTIQLIQGLNMYDNVYAETFDGI